MWTNNYFGIPQKKKKKHEGFEWHEAEWIITGFSFIMYTSAIKIIVYGNPTKLAYKVLHAAGALLYEHASLVI